MTETRSVASIKVGFRHRRELGDVANLAESIRTDGLLHPVVVTPDGFLIAGHRRLEAVKLLGWQEVPVTVRDLASIVRGEAAENFERKDFTPSEAVAIERALAPEIEAAAKDRMLAGRPSAKLAQGRARDQVARFTGMKHSTLSKAKAVVEAAESDPTKFGPLAEQMDQTGRVNGPFRRLKNIRQAEAIRSEPPPLPNRGPYRVAVCDVPWPFEPNDNDPSGRGVWPYPTMSIAALCAMPIASLMHEVSIIWFWSTNFHLRYAYQILDAWGFRNTPTVLTWAKPKMGHGHWLRGQTEHAILAIRGNPIVTLTDQTTLLKAPVRGHSVKPVEFYDFVEKLCPAPRYLDLFSRYRHNDKWDVHGDEAPKGEAAA